jgi:DNA mismatch endonuclease (patch repair protein)
MAAIGSRNTGPELALRSAMHRAGMRFRLHRRSLPGTPDVVLPRVRLAVFVDGDFWHGRLWFERGKAPRSNRPFWLAKFRRNRDRDRRVDLELLAMGWTPVRVWASEVLADPGECVRLLRMVVGQREPEG